MVTIKPIELFRMIEKYPKHVYSLKNILTSIGLTWHEKCTGLNIDLAAQYGIKFEDG